MCTLKKGTELNSGGRVRVDVTCDSRDFCVCYYPNTRRLEPTGALEFPQAKRHRVGGG
jgi:hypothetical protein